MVTESQKSKFNLLILAIIALSFSSCYTTKIVASVETDELVPHVQTHWTYFWGLIEQDQIDANCPNETISNLEVKDNFFDNLLNVVTLGIVNPVTLEWHCMPDATEDEFLDDDDFLDIQIDSLQ